MTKAEKKRLIDILDLWIESCERFYDTFKNDFVKRLDAVNELKVRCDKVYFINEFLEESRFISTDKYLEIADRYEKILDKLDEALKTKESRGIKKWKKLTRKWLKKNLKRKIQEWSNNGYFKWIF